MMIREGVGTVVGWLMAPVTGAVSAMRRARMFHPEGKVYRAEVTAARDTRWPEVAARLTGPALVRLSSAWWRGGKELPDALGFALRFARSPDRLSDGDQDLLLATIQRPWTTLLAPLKTRVHDFLMNDYYGVSPFDIDGVGRVKLRLVGPRLSCEGGSREERLQRAVDDGRAVLLLEVRPRDRHGWQSLVEVALVEAVEIDQEALRFSPFRDGRGLRPRGLVHALRRGAYAASQRLRPQHAT
jgi:hypothetical protein